MTDTAVRSVSLRATRLTACDWAFTVTPVEPDATFVWEFGDGQSAGTLEPSASHVYAGDGDRHVTVTMIAPAGADRTGNVNIVVAGCVEAAGPQAPATAESSSSSRLSSELLVLATILPLLGRQA